MPLNKNTLNLNFLACFKHITHAPTIETYTSSLSFQNLVHGLFQKLVSHYSLINFVTKTVSFSGQFTF